MTNENKGIALGFAGLAVYVAVRLLIYQLWN